MSDHLFIDPGALTTSAQEWRDQADTLDGAAARTADSDTSGFPPDVLAAATTFRRRWSDMVQSLCEVSRTFEDKMVTAAQAYVSSDQRAQDEFEAWLLQMGEEHR